MKKIACFLYTAASFLFICYLSVPTSDFPVSLPDSPQSTEPADSETPLRRAYFTNVDREGAVSWYRQRLATKVGGFTLTTLRLNYPPEEAGIVIRDQTRSSYLEEIVVPFRESLYINGFVPKEEKDAIIIEGKNWVQKLTVRHVPSPIWARIAAGGGIIVFIPILYSAWKDYLKPKKRP